MEAHVRHQLTPNLATSAHAQVLSLARIVVIKVSYSCLIWLDEDMWYTPQIWRRATNTNIVVIGLNTRLCVPHS